MKMSCQSFSSTDYTFSEAFSISIGKGAIFVKKTTRMSNTALHHPAWRSQRKYLPGGQDQADTCATPDGAETHRSESNDICLQRIKIKEASCVLEENTGNYQNDY